MAWGNADSASNYSSAGKWFKIQDGEDIHITPIGDEVVMHYQTPFGVEPKETSSEKAPGMKPRFYALVYNHDAEKPQIISLTEASMKAMNSAIQNAMKKKVQPDQARIIFSRRKEATGFVKYSAVFAGKLSADDITEVSQSYGDWPDLYEIENVVALAAGDSGSGNADSGHALPAAKPAPSSTPDEDVPF